jgi:flagellar biosynthesis/type III secretory pathway protein FliH
MALQEDRQAIEKVLAGLRQAADGFAARSEQMLGEMQQAAVELALAVAKRFLNEEIQNGRFAIENLVRQAVDRLGTRQAVTVYLNPDDLALLRSRMEEDQSLLREGNTLRLEEDRTLARGDVRAEAGENSVLAEVEAQLGNLRQQLLRSVVRARTEPGSAGP